MAVLFNQLSWEIVIDDQQFALSRTDWEKEGILGAIVYRIPYDEIATAPETILGKHTRADVLVDGVLTPKIHRDLPVVYPYPVWNFIYAKRLHIRPEVAYEPDSPMKGLFVGDFDRYDWYRAETYFGTLPFSVLPDNEITTEINRYVEIKPIRPTCEFIFLEGGQLQFTTANGLPADGPVLADSIGYRLPRCDIQLIWHSVPINYCGLFPFNIFNAQCTVNDALWNSFPEETLFLDSTEVDWEASVVNAPTLGVGPITTFPRYYKITLNLKYFKSGWNKYISPATGKMEELRWANNHAQKPYEATDFDNIFRGIPAG